MKHILRPLSSRLSSPRHVLSKPRTLASLASESRPRASLEGSSISLQLPQSTPQILNNFYLRDHCSCPECRHAITKQRLLDTFSVPTDVAPKALEQIPGGIRVRWSNDDHLSTYPWDWLRSTFSSTHAPIEKAIDWGAEIASSPPEVSYDEIMASDSGVLSWTENIRRYGFSYVANCPITPEATEQLIERIAFIRHTHYGGFWDFTADLAKGDTAYTNIALPAHTDTTYFSDPCGLQLFHLLSHTDGSGGDSLLVDGLRAARTLKRESPEAFETLANVKISSHASGNEGSSLRPRANFTVFDTASAFQTERGDELGREISMVRWNNDDRVLSGTDGVEGAEKWYEAARKWVGILRRKDMEYWAPYQPGRPVIFDNWRVLHGRGAFTGNRRMCGGYVNMDDFMSRWRSLRFSRGEILGSL